nr:MAG TPA: hypothetical protein [Caudoviricetes sp.]
MKYKPTQTPLNPLKWVDDSGQKTIIQVSFDERGTPFKRSPTHQKLNLEDPVCVNRIPIALCQRSIEAEICRSIRPCLALRFHKCLMFSHLYCPNKPSNDATHFRDIVVKHISVPSCSNANTHGRATNPRHTVALLPTRLIDCPLESRIPRRVHLHDVGHVRLPRILLLRSPSTEHGTSIFTVKHLNPVSIACNARHAVLEVPLCVDNPTILVVAEERLPPQLSPEQISDDRESVDHPLRVSNNISRVISIHFSLLPSQESRRSLRHLCTKLEQWRRRFRHPLRVHRKAHRSHCGQNRELHSTCQNLHKIRQILHPQFHIQIAQRTFHFSFSICSKSSARCSNARTLTILIIMFLPALLSSCSR